MTLMANSKVSLLTGLDSTKNQPAMSTPLVGGPSTFLQTLNNTASELDSPTDFDGLFPTKNSALETAVLVLEGASLKSSKPVDASKENPIAPIASVTDVVWLAHWFQNNSPATVSPQVPLFGSASDQVEPALMETSSKPLPMFSSELSSRLNTPIAEKSKQTPLILPDFPASAGATAFAAAPSNAADRLSLTTSFAAQPNIQPATQSAPFGMGFLDKKFPQNLPNDSGNLRPTEVLSKVSLDIGESVKSGQSVGAKDFKDRENGRLLPEMPGSAQVRLSHQGGQNLPHQTLGKEAAAPDLNPVVQWTSNFTGTVNKWVEPRSPLTVSIQSRTAATDSSTTPLLVSVLDWREPALMRTESKPLGTLSSEISSRIDVPAFEIPKQSPMALPDKPVNALASVPAAFPSNVVASLSLPTSSAIQATSQPVSIEVVILDKKSPKIFPIDGDRLKSTEVFSRAPLDIGGSVTWAQSVGFKESKGFENDRSIPVMSVSGAGLVSLDSYSGQNLPHQTVGTDAAPSGFSPDAQWTSNLADTVNQWVEQSLQFADLTIPDAGQDSLQVRIELKGQEATVYFLTDHDQYRAAIESQIENLSDRLADQGLKLAGSFVGQGNSQNSPQQQSAHSMLSRRPESEPASTRGVPVDPVLRDMKSVPNGRVLDVFA